MKILLMAGALFLSGFLSSAQTYKVLKEFTTNGSRPFGRLAISEGVIYGTTWLTSGGNGQGTVFRMNTDGTAFNVIKGFIFSDGSNPSGQLTVAGGVLYGTTRGGGNSNDGTVFRIDLDGTVHTVLRHFAGYPTDGSDPRDGVVVSGNTLYGTTYFGGTGGPGTVFKMNADGSGYVTLHNFNSDGTGPDGSLLLSGNTLYGTTFSGGTSSFGTMFKLNTDGTGFSVLKNFAGTNGSYPMAGLVLAGNALYGTTSSGGAAGRGTIFRINTDGTDHVVLKDFLGPDGQAPEAGMILMNDILYGTTRRGGDSDCGTLFQINTNGASYSVLKHFNNVDGAYPRAELAQSGNSLYGTTFNGGISNNGVVFALELPFSTGELDRTFNNVGKITTAIGSANDEARAVAIQNDGKIIAAGFMHNASNDDFAIARYNSDGTLDTSFGSNGRTNTPVQVDDEAHAIALQTDGKIIVAGRARASSQFDFALVRYNSDGTLDSTFGTSGKVTTPIFGGNDLASSVIVQSDGRIIAAGFAENGSNEDFVLVRYLTNGIPDSTFGNGGKISTDFRGLGYSEAGKSVVLQNDGRIILAGGTWDGNKNEFAMARYTTNGTLDSSFGNGGKITIGFGNSHEYAHAIAVQNDGRIVVAGYANHSGNESFALVRLNTNGVLDTTFGNSGKVTTDFGAGIDESLSIAIQPDGKIVAAGFAGNGSNEDFALARYDSTGALDPSFGNGGKVTTPIGTGHDRAFSMALQNDYKIVLAGRSHNGANWDFAIARYNGNSPPTQINLSSTSIVENSPAGSVVGSITATDSDSNDDAIFTLVSGPGADDNSSFGIIGSNLVAATVFNFEAKSSYSIRIRIADKGGLYFEKTFAILIENVAEPASFSSATWLAGVFGFQITGSSGSTNIVETSTNLVTWHPVATNILPVDGIFHFTNPPAGSGNLFFRMKSFE